MTKTELLKLINEENINSDIYDFSNGHGFFDDQFILNFSNDVWVVYYLERGKKEILQNFDSESKANIYFYNKISEYNKKIKK